MGKKKSSGKNTLFSCDLSVADIDAEGIKFENVTRLHAENGKKGDKAVDVILGKVV